MESKNSDFDLSKPFYGIQFKDRMAKWWMYENYQYSQYIGNLYLFKNDPIFQTRITLNAMILSTRAATKPKFGINFGFFYLLIFYRDMGPFMPKKNKMGKKMGKMDFGPPKNTQKFKILKIPK